jgi:hypothetical protein
VTAIAPRALGTRLESVRAQERVADALLGVALDVLEPFACDYLSAADYSQLCARVQAPVSAATEAALATFMSELVLLMSADPGIEARLDRTEHYAHPLAE